MLSSHSSSSAILSFNLPLIGISIVERLRDRGFDTIICYDDSSKHSKSYRQISSILPKIPSRDAFPSDIFNIHASILERGGKPKTSNFNGSITSFPIIETIANDITEHIATNIISITDRQLYTNKNLFLTGFRPCVDSALSVSRIGSNAQCKLMKVISVGLKNELTNFRLTAFSSIISIKHIIFISSYLLFIFIYLLLLLNNIILSYIYLLLYILLNNIIIIKCRFIGI